MSNNPKDFFVFQNLAVYTSNHPRQAYRAFPDDLWIRIKGKKAPCRVINISISGICFELSNADQLKKLIPGKCLALKIVSPTHGSIATLIGQIIRKDPMSVSCVFVDLTKENEVALDKLLLVMQKEEINYIKQQRLLKIQKNNELQASQATVPLDDNQDIETL